ncbi:hypothetical protein KAT92_06085 [Candidatus Babeliales bacterium]|nr:hypothetical protein [Candidatus Babeliales bacterium]
MEARKIDLTDYVATEYAEQSDGTTKEVPIMVTVGDETTELMYRVKSSIATVLMELRVSGMLLLERNDLALKIRNCIDDSILLTNDEVVTLERAFKEFDQFGMQEVELVSRVLRNPVMVELGEVE